MDLKVLRTIKKKAELGLLFIDEKLFSKYDLNDLLYINIDFGKSNKKYNGVWGYCYAPSPRRKQYRISCHLGIDFPHTIRICEEPLFVRIKEDNPKISKKFYKRKAGVVIKDGKKHRWYRMYSKTLLNDYNEALVWIVSHEMYHYLTWTKQIIEKNNEIEADRFANKQLISFRKFVEKRS